MPTWARGRRAAGAAATGGAANETTYPDGRPYDDPTSTAEICCTPSSTPAMHECEQRFGAGGLHEHYVYSTDRRTERALTLD